MYHLDQQMQARHWLIVVLVSVELFFVAMTVASLWLEPQIARITRLFDLNRELSIPTWFASSQLLLVGVIVWLCGSLRARDDRPSRAFFTMSGACFVYLSMDEAAGLHERITTNLRHYPWTPHFSGNHGVWIFAYGALFAVVLFWFRRDLTAALQLYRDPSALLIGGFLVMVAGGVGVEILLYEAIRDDSPEPVKVAQYAVEEFLELLGGSIMLYGAIGLHEQISARGAGSFTRDG